MKRAFIVPGWKATPDSSWFRSLERWFEARGVQARVLRMPHRHAPIMASWVRVIASSVGQPDRDTFLIGHSSGAVAILRYLEALPPGERIGGCVLVSGFPQALLWARLPHVLTRKPRVRDVAGKCDWILAVHSSDDWRVPLSNGEWLREQLCAELIVLERAGHITAKSGFRELPERVLDRIAELIETGVSGPSPKMRGFAEE